MDFFLKSNLCITLLLICIVIKSTFSCQINLTPSTINIYSNTYSYVSTCECLGGNTDIHFTWRRNGRNLVNTDNVFLTAGRSNVINFQNINATEDGVYTCIASRIGVELAHAQLTIYVPPKLRILSDQATFTVGAGSSFVLQCPVQFISEHSTLIIDWILPSGIKLNSRQSISHDERFVYNATSKDLIVYNVGSTDSGNYICSAYNQASSVTFTHNIIIRDLNTLPTTISTIESTTTPTTPQPTSTTTVRPTTTSPLHITTTLPPTKINTKMETTTELNVPVTSTTVGTEEGFFNAGFNHPLFSALYIFLIILACIVTTCIISITSIISIACFCIIKHKFNKETTYDLYSRSATARTSSSCQATRNGSSNKINYPPSPVHSCSSGGSHNNNLNSNSNLKQVRCNTQDMFNMDVSMPPSQNSYNPLPSDRGYHTHSSSDTENNYYNPKHQMQNYIACSRCSSMAHSESKLNSPNLAPKYSSKKNSFNQNDDHLHPLRQTFSQNSTLSREVSTTNLGQLGDM